MNYKELIQPVEDLEKLVENYQKILQLDKNNAEVWCNLGIAYYRQGQYQEALESLYQSLEIDASSAIQYYSLGLVLEKIGYLRDAIQAYQQAIALDPSWIEVYQSLGQILCEVGELEQAEAIYSQATSVDKNNPYLYLNLGNLLIAQQQINQAITVYETALALNPRDSDILNNLAIAFELQHNRTQACLYFGYAAYYQENYTEAISYYQEFLENQIGDVEFYITLTDCYLHLNQSEAAIKIYQKSLILYPGVTELYLGLIYTLQHCGKTQEASQVANDALNLMPNDLCLKIEKQRILPLIYKNPEEIQFYRQQVVQGLSELTKTISLDTPEARKSALKAIGWRTNFYIQYQGYNDLELQQLYGKFVHQVMAANYPQWVKLLMMPPLSENQKIRIGYISDCLHWHTVGMVFLGWIENFNDQQFTVSCYSTHRKIDQVTEQFQRYSNHFHYIPNNLEAVCQQIISDQLHILVFLDIGMSPQMTQIAGLRLAPIQCAAWGHPVTSGLPTIDYFLSGDLMEPENAQSHYSEQLIRLPNIGITYPQPLIPEPTKTRSDFGLREDAVVYLSCQSLFKYLPQYDFIFAGIAQQVPQSQFVFVSHSSAQITEQFRLRLQGEFERLGLDSKEYCVILPRQSHLDYWHLNLVADIVLDTFGFTGFLTTLDSIACGLPVVTCPGEFMRSRQSYGILRKLGITETIAQDEAEYLEIAIQLGLDREWRYNIVQRIKQSHSSLYNDKACVAALEAFYQQIAHR